MRHEDVLKEALRDPVAAAAYAQRRYVQEVGLAIRSMREQAGLSQAELGALVGMKQPAIARLETSQANAPQWNTLNRIGMALGKQLSFDLGAVDFSRPLVRIRDAKRPKTHDHETRS